MVMKTKIILFLVLILISCSGVKKSTKTDVKSDLKTNTEVSKESSSTGIFDLTKNSTSAIDSSDIKALQLFELWKKNYQANVKTYDTSKPIVPGTNKPPIASETIITNIESNDKNLQENSKSEMSKTEIQQLEASFRIQYESKIDSLQNVIDQRSDNSSSKEKPPNNWWKWLIVGFCIPFVLLIIWKLK